MPRLSLRRRLLSSLDTFIILFSLLSSTTSATSPTSPTSPTFFPKLILCFTLVSFANSNDDEQDEDENVANQERIIILAFTILILATMDQSAYMNQRKRKREEDETVLSALLLVREKAHRRRYLLPRYRRPRCNLKAAVFQGWFDETDRTWISVARMSKTDFTKLLHRIAPDPIFQNNSQCPQAPPQWQLLVALANFGLSGNGGSTVQKAKLFSLAEGSVENYTKRCIHAILELESEYVRWPNANERSEIKKRIGQNSFFQDCIGFIDGTLVPLARAPSKNKEDYYTRKSIYALNSLIICDDRRKVLYAQHGWCGSAHDQRVLKSTNFYQDIASFFLEGEYILADSGYASTEHIVPNFKRSRYHSLTSAQNHFNNSISKIRIASEHCNGMLQMRFGSLHELRLCISNSKDAMYACRWVGACVVVHNFVIEEGTPMYGMTAGNHFQVPAEPLEPQGRSSSYVLAGGPRRDSLFDSFCNFNNY